MVKQRDSMSICLDMVQACDRQTDRQTDGWTAPAIVSL